MNAIIDHPTFTDTTATSSHGHFTIFTANRQADFLRNLQLFGNVRLACRAACVSAQTAYRARRASPGFALAWDAACLAARSHAEQVLADRAINGVEEAVYYHGEEVARRRRFDSRLLLAHLARLDRLEQRAEIAETLPLLDALVDALGEGADIDTVLRSAASAQMAAQRDAGGIDPLECVPGVPSCRVCERPDAPSLGDRLDAMDAARPAGALTPSQLVREGGGDQDVGEIEYAQLEAFEAGEARWWEVTVGGLAGAVEGDADGASTDSRGRSRTVALGVGSPGTT